MAYPFEQIKNDLAQRKGQKPLSRWFRRVREAWAGSGFGGVAPSGDSPARTLLFEALEPRILMSADLSYADMPEAADLTLRFEQSAQQFQLINQAGQLDSGIVASVDAASALADGILSIADNGTTSLLRLDVDSLLSVNISLLSTGAADDTLRVFADADFRLLGSSLTVGDKAFGLTGFENVSLLGGAGDNAFFVDGWSGAVTVDGGAGNDTLAGPAADSTWTLTQVDGGRVGNTAFVHIENLKGSTGNQDTFVLAAGAGLTGILDGGDGGFDSLVIDGGAHQNLAFTASGPNSGTVTLDGQEVSYAGLEPITVSGTAANVTVDGSIVSDDLVLERVDATNLRVRTTNGSIESVQFADPTGSFTVNMLLGADTFTLGGTLDLNADLILNGGTLTDAGPVDGRDQVSLNGTLNLHGHSLTVKADTIAVGATGVVSTQEVDANQAATANAGNITFTGQTIDIAGGGKLLSSVEAGSQFTPGSITLRSEVQDFSSLSPLDVFPSDDVTITIGAGAVLSGGDISITGEKTSKTGIQTLLSVVGVQNKKVTIDVQGASIRGKSVTIGAKAADENLLESSEAAILVNNFAIQPISISWTP